MLPLVAVNAGAALAFGAIYAAGAVRLLSQAAFLAALAVAFLGAVAVWAAVEGTQGRGRDAVARLGRVVAALLLVLLGAPALALTPLFAIQSQVPAEAGFDAVISRTMALLLVAVLLVGLVNLAGGLVVAVGALARRARGASGA